MVNNPRKDHYKRKHKYLRIRSSVETIEKMNKMSAADWRNWTDWLEALVLAEWATRDPNTGEKKSDHDAQEKEMAALRARMSRLEGAVEAIHKLIKDLRPYV